MTSLPPAVAHVHIAITLQESVIPYRSKYNLITSMRPDKIRRTFEALLTTDNAAGRGRAFEKLLRAKLSVDGYSVRINPKAAKPRQTDLIASLDSQDCLIEAKWRQRKVDVADVDSVRARLRRTPPDFIGCIFNMSDFTATAVAAVESDRTREILLFNAGEINSIFTGRSSIRELIQLKRDALRFEARALFCDGKSSVSSTSSQFPVPAQQLSSDEKFMSYVSFPTNGQDTAFFLAIPDIYSSDTSANLEIRLDVQSIDELADILTLIGRTIGLSEAGCFSIHQRSHSWHGFGAHSFLEAARNWQQRYREADLESPHHSEVLAYFDKSKGALITLTSQQRIGESGFLHSSFLELQLAGIPVDMSSLLELCRRTNNPDALMGTRMKESLHQVHLNREILKLKPVARIITGHSGKEWVCGIVAKNPFRVRRVMKRLAPSFDDFFLRHLPEPEFLICHMDDYYLTTDEVTQPFISHIYAVWSGHMPLLNVHCTWDNFTRRAPEEEADWEALLREIPDVIGDDDDLGSG